MRVRCFGQDRGSPVGGSIDLVIAVLCIADMEGVEGGLEPEWTHTPTGVYSFGPVPGRILTVQFTGAPDRAIRDQPVTVEELQASIRLVTGQDITVKAIHGRATR